MKTTIEQTPLSVKQQRFCDEYLLDMNATRAALAAGYSKSTAMSGQLMNTPAIAAYLDERLKAASAGFEVSHKMIVAELAKIAFANIGNYFADDGKLKPMHLLTDNEKAALWNLKVTEHKDGSTTVQLRLCNKLSALEKLAKHTGFYKALQKAEGGGQGSESEKVVEGAEKRSERDLELDAEYFRLEKWRDELVDKKMELDEREKDLLKLEDELRRRMSDVGAAQADACARGGLSSDQVGETTTVAAEPVKVIGHLPGQYTPEGYLIKTDMPADRDKSDPYYNPFARTYIEKKTGTMLIKSYLPDPPDEVMDAWRRSRAEAFRSLKAETLEG